MNTVTKLTIPELEQGKIRVAFASSDGIIVDDHFGWARSFFLFDVSADGFKKSGRIICESETSEGANNEDKLEAKIDALRGCHIVYSRAIGGPAAARLTRQRIQPLIAKDEVDIVRLIEMLREVMNGPMPPWLRKITRPDDPARFEEYDAAS